MPPSNPKPLKRTAAFHAIYRRGRWAHGAMLSVGALGNQLPATRVGLRTGRGIKRAVERNRLKRQLRALVFTPSVSFRHGLDVIIVARPKQPSVKQSLMAKELKGLCQRLGVLA